MVRRGVLYLMRWRAGQSLEAGHWMMRPLARVVAIAGLADTCIGQWTAAAEAWATSDTRAHAGAPAAAARVARPSSRVEGSRVERARDAARAP